MIVKKLQIPDDHHMLVWDKYREQYAYVISKGYERMCKGGRIRQEVDQ